LSNQTDNLRLLISSVEDDLAGLKKPAKGPKAQQTGS
jgi:hypothetical protein